MDLEECRPEIQAEHQMCRQTRPCIIFRFKLLKIPIYNEPCDASPARFSHFKGNTDNELHEHVESYVLKTDMHKLVGEEPPNLKL